MPRVTYPGGVHHLSGEFTLGQAKNIISALPDVADVLPDYDDISGNRGYIVWKHNEDENIPTFAHRALALVQSTTVKRESLRSIQLNHQGRSGSQEAHTDYPFTSSMTMHLSPEGGLIYQTPNDDEAIIRTNIGDVVILERANETLHRGINLSDIGRVTLSFFFNGKAFSL